MKILIRALAIVSLLALGAQWAIAGQENPWATPPVGRDYLPSKVIFPEQTIPLRFFHDKHLAQEIDCATCHEKALDSVSSSDQLVPVGAPGEDACQTCHDFSTGAQADPPSACETCHANYAPVWKDDRKKDDFRAVNNPPAAMILPQGHIKMNHKLHVDKGIACATCHGDLKNVQVATVANAMPVMMTCMECHDGKQASDNCRTCHIADPSGRLVQKFDSGVLKPAGHFRNDAHDDAWLANHAMTAQNDDRYCSNCHEQKYCLDCHNGVVKPFKVHPNNFVLTHPVHARRSEPSCSGCHRAQNFCLDCHKRSGVASATDFKGGGEGRAWETSKLGKFHPDGWVGTIQNGGSRGPSHHAFQAQRNIRACAACHTEKTCLTCHASGTMAGVGINPHPPSFGSSAKCKSLRATNPQMCAQCHLPVPACN